MIKGAGVILAGGKATRLSGISKADIMIGNHSCLERAQRVLAQSLNEIVVSGHIETDLQTLADWPNEGRGGVAFAVLGALNWARTQGFDFIVTLPVDTPFLPLSFTRDLSAEFKVASHSVAFKQDGRVQGLHALWPVASLGRLKVLILELGVCKIESLHEKMVSRYVQFPETDCDPFFNLNTQADIGAARRLVMSTAPKAQDCQ